MLSFPGKPNTELELCDGLGEASCWWQQNRGVPGWSWDPYNRWGGAERTAHPKPSLTNPLSTPC